MKVAFHTLGCKVNQYETKAMEELFHKEGHEVISFDDKADVYIVNTCTVTNIADKKSRKMLSKARQMNPESVVVAVGCYVQTGSEALSAQTDIDLMIGTTHKNDIVTIVTNHLNQKVSHRGLTPWPKKRATVSDPGGPKSHEFIEDVSQGRVYEELWVSETMEQTRAYIKVQDGCDQFCSYCIIPYTRGRVRSRRLEQVVEEVTGMVAKGYHEFVLTGIHLASYGKEFEGMGLIDLMEAVSAIEGVWRLRLGSLEPTLITDKFVERLSQLDKVCPHFHLSLQSGCNKTLKAMNRKYTIEDYDAGVKRLRSIYKHPAITTDIIVGFPGETEEDFVTTYDNLEKIGFSNIHIFKYSKRDGTKAAEMAEQIAPTVKHERSQRLQKLADQMKTSYEQLFVGNEVELMVEVSHSQHEDYYVGHAREFFKVYVQKDKDHENKVAIGSLIQVKPKGLFEDGLIAEKVKEI